MEETGGHPRRDDLIRWGGGLLIAGALHAAALGGALFWRTPVDPAGAETAMLIDMAPPEPAPEPPAPEPPAPEPPAPEPIPEPPPPEPPPPEPPPPEPIPEPPPPEPPPEPPPPEPEPEPPPPVENVAVPLPPPPPVVKPKPIEKKPSPKVVKPPPPAAVPAAPAPISAPPAPPAPHVLPSWQAQVMAHLERRKRYPRAAQFRREEGTARVRFVIDRAGVVLSFRLEGSSGSAELDQETLSLIERASPLPPPPAEIARDHMEMVAPVKFALR
jgi:periplasmic protein TonB